MLDYFVFLLSTTIVIVAGSPTTRENLPEWNHLIYGYSSHRCYTIPSNFTLCRNIGYEKMILPNFLQHESVFEATSSAKDWQMLMKSNCHYDTRRFLCSLYAPVCVPNEPIRKIQPCRELCVSVKKSCSASLLTYGYKWPDILHCDKFPQKMAGLCIRGTEGTATGDQDPNQNSGTAGGGSGREGSSFGTGQSSQQSGGARSPQCNCQSIFSQQSLPARFCAATTVLKAKIGRLTALNSGRGGSSGWQMKLAKKSKIIKSRYVDMPLLTRPVALPCECPEAGRRGEALRRGRWLLMGASVGGVFRLAGLVRWRKTDRALKRALRRVRRQERSICGSAFQASEPRLRGLNILGQKNPSRKQRRRRKRRREQAANP